MSKYKLIYKERLISIFNKVITLFFKEFINLALYCAVNIN